MADGGKSRRGQQFPVDDVVLEAYRSTQDRHLGEASRAAAERAAARARRKAHRDRLRALQPALDAWLAMMQAGDIPDASKDTPGLERFGRRKPKGCRLVHECKFKGGLDAGWVAHHWYALLANGEWWRGYTVDSYPGSIRWATSDALTLVEPVELTSLDGDNFVPLDDEWRVNLYPWHYDTDWPRDRHYTLDYSIQTTMGYIGACHRLGLPGPLASHADWD